MKLAMGSELAWANGAELNEFVASQLLRGRLLLCLGSGVSKFYGLPEWRGLLEATAKPVGVNIGQSSLTVEAERVFLEGYKEDSAAFHKAIHSALYGAASGEGTDERIIQNRTLRAFGALVSQSLRGKVASILTLNYDDLVERYMAVQGYVVQTVVSQFYLTSPADVVIYHPHGYLPENASSSDFETDLVFTRSDYERAIEEAWQEAMVQLFATHFVLFIGLSGEDDRLSNIISHAKRRNPYTVTHRFPYFGVRLCSGDDPLRSIWEKRGIYCHCVPDLSIGIPEYLFGICQLAATKLGNPNDL